MTSEQIYENVGRRLESIDPDMFDRLADQVQEEEEDNNS
jgi:hypothetical protein